MSNSLARALSSSSSVRVSGSDLETYEVYEYDIDTVNYLHNRHNGKKRITVYVTPGADPIHRFWVSEKDIARIYGAKQKLIAQHRRADKRISPADERRISFEPDEVFLCLVKWRQIVYTWKPLAASGNLVRSALDRLVSALTKRYPHTPITADSTVHETAKQEEEEVSKRESTWTPAREVPPSLPPLKVFKVVTVEYPEELILAAIRRSDPRIGSNAKLCRTDDVGVFKVEWEETE